MLKLTAMAVLSYSLAGVGCTRGAKSSVSVNLSFKASEVAKMSSNLSVVVINVTGGNLQAPRYLHWDKHDCGSDSCEVPPAFEVNDIPSGGEVFVQVLAVFEDSDTEAMTFKYADANKAISSGTNEISLTPAAIGGATTQANIYGRYLNQVGGSGATGPTGIMEVRFRPPASASVKADPPALTVERSPMFAGWASFFALDGDAKFNYVVNGTPIMMDVNIASLEGMTSPRFLEIDIPDYERTHWVNGTPSGFQSEKAQKIFIGYLGPQATTEKACFKNGDEAITDVFVAGSSGATPVHWNSSASNASAAVIAVENGGLAYTAGDSSVCDTASTEFADHMSFNYMGLRNGHDSVGGIRGPFRTVTANGDYVDAVSSGTGLFLNFSLLPGVANPTGVTSVRVYARPTPADGSESGLYGGGDGIQCSKIDKVGFTALGEIPAITGATSLSATFPSVTTSNTDFVVCPVLSNIVADAGVKVNSVHPAATFKIIGSNTTSSNLDGPGISPGMQLLKDAFINNFHNIVFQAQNQYILPSDVDSAYVRIDGGPWYPVNVNSANFLGHNNVSFIGVNSGNGPLYSLLTADDSSVNVRFQVKLNASGISTFGSNNAELVSESFRLIGANDCASPGALQAFDLDSSTYFTASNLLDIGTAAGHHRFQMRWPGCGAGANWAAAVLDYVQMTGTPAPTGCFGNGDIALPSALEIKILGHAACDLNSLSTTFFAPSNAGSDSVFASGSGISIAP